MSLLWGLVAVVHCPTVPYVSFMGVNLPNHSYVDLTTVGNDINDPGNTVRCHTDLSTCCSIQSVHRGEWYFPDDSVLDNAGGGGNIYRCQFYCVEMMLPHHLVYIVVRFQLMLSMIMST